MAVIIDKTPAADAAADTPAQAEPVTFKLELTKIGRYNYGGMLYLKEEQYVFDEAGARHMLALRDPADLPVFRVARPRRRMIAVDDDQAVVVKSPVRPPRVDRVVSDLQDFKFGQPPQPIGKIELGGDDAETAERLAALDAQGGAEAGLIDTGTPL